MNRAQYQPDVCGGNRAGTYGASQMIWFYASVRQMIDESQDTAWAHLICEDEYGVDKRNRRCFPCQSPHSRQLSVGSQHTCQGTGLDSEPDKAVHNSIGLSDASLGSQELKLEVSMTAGEIIKTETYLQGRSWMQ